MPSPSGGYARLVAAASILVVDDDAPIRRMLARTLQAEGYAVEAAADGGAALAALESGVPDLVVLDVAMPGLDGLAVSRLLRRRGLALPILMLTARDAVEDRVAGLDAGADDYLVKPFALDELLARLRALLRRTEADATGVLEYAHLRIDPTTREVTCGERALELTRTEFALLELLARNPRVVLPRRVIFERVWGYDFGPDSNSLEVFVGYLRRKTEADGEPRLIQTVRGVGYVLREQ